MGGGGSFGEDSGGAKGAREVWTGGMEGTGFAAGETGADRRADEEVTFLKSQPKEAVSERLGSAPE